MEESPGRACRASVGPTCWKRVSGPLEHLPPKASEQRQRRAGITRGGRGRLRVHLFQVCVQDSPSQMLCPKDALEPCLQLPEKVLPLWTQQEPGTAWVLQAQHVTANTTQQTLQKLLGCLAWGQGSIELQGRGVGEQLAGLAHRKDTRSPQWQRRIKGEDSSEAAHPESSRI